MRVRLGEAGRVSCELGAAAEAGGLDAFDMAVAGEEEAHSRFHRHSDMTCEIDRTAVVRDQSAEGAKCEGPCLNYQP